MHRDLSESTNFIGNIPPFVPPVGTGGLLTYETFYIPIHKVEQNSLHTDICFALPSKQLHYIQKIFGLNISELSNILGVSRPTLYSWLQGKEPKKNALLKIIQLVKYGKHVEKFKIKRFEIYLHRPMFEGYSLYDKLKNNEDIIQILSMIVDICKKESEARLTLKGSQENKNSDNLRDHSTPFYRE